MGTAFLFYDMNCVLNNTTKDRLLNCRTLFVNCGKDTLQLDNKKSYDTRDCDESQASGTYSKIGCGPNAIATTTSLTAPDTTTMASTSTGKYSFKFLDDDTNVVITEFNGTGGTLTYSYNFGGGVTGTQTIAPGDSAVELQALWPDTIFRVSTTSTTTSGTPRTQQQTFELPVRYYLYGGLFQPRNTSNFKVLVRPTPSGANVYYLTADAALPDESSAEKDGADIAKKELVPPDSLKKTKQIELGAYVTMAILGVVVLVFVVVLVMHLTPKKK
jgi:hypothetical protein